VLGGGAPVFCHVPPDEAGCAPTTGRAEAQSSKWSDPPPRPARLPPVGVLLRLTRVLWSRSARPAPQGEQEETQGVGWWWRGGGGAIML